MVYLLQGKAILFAGELNSYLRKHGFKRIADEKQCNPERPIEFFSFPVRVHEQTPLATLFSLLFLDSYLKLKMP